MNDGLCEDHPARITHSYTLKARSMVLLARCDPPDAEDAGN